MSMNEDVGPVRKLKTHCKRGHEYTPENTGVLRGNTRFCLTCDRARKDAHRRKRISTEKPVDVACPTCRVIRTVGATTARRLLQFPRECASCSRKRVRKGMTFAPTTCAQCGNSFSGRSGATKYCDACAGRKPIPLRECPICKKSYQGYKGKKACSTSCLRRLRLNDTYFGGRLFETIGWADKVCQICECVVVKRYHVHHVFGHPDHSRLVILCAGCHDLVSKIAMRKEYPDTFYDRLRWYAMAQKHGRIPDGDEPPIITGRGDHVR